jgi:hypothetical protein
MHTSNLKAKIIEKFTQCMTKHLEEEKMNLPELYQESCAMRKISVSEFERGEKGKYTTYALQCHLMCASLIVYCNHRKPSRVHQQAIRQHCLSSKWWIDGCMYDNMHELYNEADTGAETGYTQVCWFHVTGAMQSISSNSSNPKGVNTVTLFHYNKAQQLLHPTPFCIL